MWAAVALLLALLGGPVAVSAANFDTATVDGVLAITSDWNGGFCGSLMTRNPGTNPSTTWAGLFTFSGGTLTTGPNGNGVSKKISDTQWTFVPDDPAQEAIYPQSTVMVTFCCDAENKQDVQASFRVIYSFDYKGVGYNPPPPSPSPPSSPSLPPSPAPSSDPSDAPALAPAADEEAAESGASGAPAPAPEPAGSFVVQESMTMPDAGQDIALTVPTPTPTDTPAASSAARIMGQTLVLVATAAAAFAAAVLV